MSTEKSREKVRAWRDEEGGITWLFMLRILKLSYLFAFVLYIAIMPTADIYTNRVRTFCTVYSQGTRGKRCTGPDAFALPNEIVDDAAGVKSVF